MRSPVGAILSALRDNPLRAAALGHNIHGYKLTAFMVAATYAGFAGGLLGLMQGYMPPDAFMFDTSGQLVMQTVIGGAGTLFGPLVGAAVWLYLSDFFQNTLHLGATWKLVLGIVFVLLVVSCRRGIVGAIVDLYRLIAGRTMSGESGAIAQGEPSGAPVARGAETAMPAPHRPSDRTSGPILQATGLTKRYGGLIANNNIDFTVDHGELRGIIGPNGAGKSTFFKMLTCEVHPTAGRILFEGRDITGMGVTDVCQLGLTKSYQINQLFDRLTVRQNLTIAALARSAASSGSTCSAASAACPGSTTRSRRTLALVDLDRKAGLAGLATCLWREAAARDRARARDRAEPAAARRAARRHEPAGAGRDGRAAQIDPRGRTMIVIDHDMDSLFELVDKVTVLQEGRVLVEGTPEEIKVNAEVQEAYLGGVHGEAA